MEERLDRFVCNKDWSENFTDYEASNLDTWTSDHCLVLMVVQERSGGINLGGRQSSRIHYKDMWSPYDVCKKIIKEEWSLYDDWNNENPIQSFQKTTKESMARLLY